MTFTHTSAKQPSLSGGWDKYTQTRTNEGS